MRGVLDSFIGSYADRNVNIPFSDWLAERLRQELPEMEQDASLRLANDIIEAIAGYDKTLDDLNRAVEAGQAKEDWLSDKLSEVYHDDIPIDAAGNSLQHMESDLISSNLQLMGEIDKPAAGERLDAEPEVVDWNRYTLRAKVNNIVEQINAAILFAAANALNRYIQGGDVGPGTIIKDALEGGLKASPEEVKAVVAAAVKVAVEKGLMDVIPFDIPVEVIGDLAGAAVEVAKALLYDAVQNTSVVEALEKVGRAGIAASCKFVSICLRGQLLEMPLGPILVDLLGGLLDHLGSPQFVDNVCTMIRDLTADTMKGIMESKTVTIVGEVLTKKEITT